MRYQSIVACAAAAALTTIAITSSTPRANAEQRGVDVLDVEISALQDPRIWGREGVYPNGRIGLGLVTTSHNVGTVPVDWFEAGPIGETLDNRHPFIGQNLYRERSGRLEQIGLAWLKHGFFAVNDGCPDPGGSMLGVGCFDTYGNFTNANRQHLGPRSEVNPRTGFWEPCGSHFDTGEVGYPPSVPGDCVSSHYSNFTGHDLDDHRLRASDQDILAADSINRYFIEGFYIVADDEDIENNYAHRQIRMIPPTVEPDWTFEPISNFEQRPAIDDWGDDVVNVFPDDEGRVRVAVRVVPLGGGDNRYEYNIYNMTLDRQLDSFSVPLSPGVNITDIGFHAPVEDEEPLFSMAPWTANVSADAITWSAPSPDMGAGEEFPNTLRYGTMYTFWFTADIDAAPSTLAMTPYKAGVASLFSADLAAPCDLAPDINGDGVVDTADLGLLIGAFGTSDPVSDINGDGVVDTADLGQLIAAFGADCIAG